MKPFMTPFTAGLYVLSGAIALTTIVCAWRGTQTTALLATAPAAVPAPRQHLQTPARPVDVAVIQDAPLFHESRRFFVAPVATASTPPLPGYALVGTFAIPNKPTLAFLKSTVTGAARKVAVGETLDGWTVDRIETRRLVLKYQNENREILASARSVETQPAASLAAAGRMPDTPLPNTAARPTRPGAAAPMSATPAGSGVTATGGVTTPISVAEQLRRLAQGPAPVNRGNRPLPNNDPARSGYVNPGQPLNVTGTYRGPRQ